MINLGIIGCGWQTEQAHLPVLSRLPGIRPVAACDILTERLERVQRRFGIQRVTPDWTEIMADPSIDAILIATPADSHVYLAEAALEANKHLLVEKPFALTVTEAERLAEKARLTSAVSMVGLNFRFHPLASELRALIRRGVVGQPRVVFTTLTSSLGQRRSITGYEALPDRGGGIFHDKVVHSVDLLRFLFDSDIVEGKATACSVYHPHDVARIELVLSNGVWVLGYFCNHAISDMTVQVIGDEGKARINLSRPAGVALYHKGFSRSRATKLLAYIRQTGRLVSAFRYSTPAGRLISYSNQWRHFQDCIESSRKPQANFADGLAATRTVAQLISSLPEAPDGQKRQSRKVAAGKTT